MATRPELHIAVAKTKSKASEYNDNFDMMMQYVEDSMEEFMPSTTGHSGEFLTNNGSTTSWADVFGSNNTFTGKNTFSGDVVLSGDVALSGNTNIVALAHELDYDNAITVSTTSSSSRQTYTCPKDGILSISSIATSGTKSIGAAIYNTDETSVLTSIIINNLTSSASIEGDVYWTYIKDEVAHYYAYAAGSGTGISVKFIPFKKGE